MTTAVAALEEVAVVVMEQRLSKFEEAHRWWWGKEAQLGAGGCMGTEMMRKRGSWGRKGSYRHIFVFVEI